ncbi:MAG: hypothetical protein R3B54_05465 [Bdellovibrionota bacterium]
MRRLVSERLQKAGSRAVELRASLQAKTGALELASEVMELLSLSGPQFMETVRWEGPENSGRLLFSLADSVGTLSTSSWEQLQLQPRYDLGDWEMSSLKPADNAEGERVWEAALNENENLGGNIEAPLTAYWREVNDKVEGPDLEKPAREAFPTNTFFLNSYGSRSPYELLLCDFSFPGLYRLAAGDSRERCSAKYLEENSLDRLHSIELARSDRSDPRFSAVFFVESRKDVFSPNDFTIRMDSERSHADIRGETTACRRQQNRFMKGDTFECVLDGRVLRVGTAGFRTDNKEVVLAVEFLLNNSVYQRLRVPLVVPRGEG